VLGALVLTLDRHSVRLQERYNNSLAKFNKAWKTNLQSWDALADLHPLPTSDARSADNVVYVEHYMDTYLRVAVGAIKSAVRVRACGGGVGGGGGSGSSDGGGGGCVHVWRGVAFCFFPSRPR